MTYRPYRPYRSYGSYGSSTPNDGKPTPAQLNYIRSLARGCGLDVDAVIVRAESLDRKGVSQLIDRLKAMPTVPYQHTAEDIARADALRAVVDSLDAYDRRTATDLLAKFDAGRVSEAQLNYIDGLAKKATAPKIEPGLYMVDDRIVRVYLNQNRRLSTQVLQVYGDHGSFSYAPGWLAKVRPEHRLTEEQARAFGKQHGFCCACALSLNDSRSVAVGYGPKCAKRYGWFYPTAKQASEMLNYPTTIA